MQVSVREREYINDRCRISLPKRHLLALEALLVEGESILQELLLLLEVNGLETSSDGGAAGTTSVQDVATVVVLGGVEQALDTGLGVGPGTGVEGLLLAPNDVLGVGVAVKVLLELSPWEGVQLLNTGDGGVADAVGLTVLDESSVDLTRAKDDTLDLLGGVDGGTVALIGDDPLEVRVTAQGLDIRAGNRVAQQRLGEEDDQRLAELAVNLATKDVEQVGRSGHAGNLHVAVLVLAVELVSRGVHAGLLVAKLEPALHTTGRVLWTLAIVTVRQRDNQTGTLQPLGFTGGDELINDALSVVGEVTELSLPHNKGVGGGQRITVLEAETTELTQRGVRDDEAALLVTDVLQGSVGTLSLLVVQYGVTLRESTTLNILTGNTDVVSLVNEGTEGKSLGGSPVNVLALIDGLLAATQDTLEVAVELKAIGSTSAADLVSNVLQGLLADSGGQVRQDFGGQFLGRLEVVPGGSEPLLTSGLVVLAAVEAVAEHSPDPLLVLIDVLLGEGTLGNQLLDVLVKLSYFL